MKPQQFENARYKKEDHCDVKLEEQLMFSMLKDYAKDKKNFKVLDIGCGSGRITKKIKDLGLEVEGLDFSEEAVKKAVSNGIKADVCDLDEGIIKKDNEFDAVWAGDIIEHVFDPINLIREINRVLKKNGVLILAIPSDVGLISRIKMLLGQSYQEQMYRRSGFYKHHTFFNLSLIKFMLGKGNFSINKIEKLLILNKKRYHVNALPSAFYNQLVIIAKKNEV